MASGSLLRATAALGRGGVWLVGVHTPAAVRPTQAALEGRSEEKEEGAQEGKRGMPTTIAVAAAEEAAEVPPPRRSKDGRLLMKLNIQHPRGFAWKVRVPPNITVSGLMRRIFLQYGLPPAHQRLALNEGLDAAELPPDKSLFELGIQAADSVWLTIDDPNARVEAQQPPSPRSARRAAQASALRHARQAGFAAEPQATRSVAEHEVRDCSRAALCPLSSSPAAPA